MAERLTLVDENDQPITVGDRKLAWAQGYYTRNIRVVLRDENGRLLSQQRSMKKDSFPGMWTVAASGHVDEGETWDVAARREAQEEIGISPDLKLIGEFTFKHDESDKKIRQIIHVYEGTIDSATSFAFEPDEVQDAKWFDLDELKELLKTSQDIFTPSFAEIITMFY